MTNQDSKLRRWRVPLWIGAALLAYLVVTVDDWRRDFTTNHAEISRNTTDPTLRVYVSDRSTEELVEALKWSARRIGGWEYIGTTTDEKDVYVVFVRKSPVFRFKDRIEMRIRDWGDKRVIAGRSQSAWGIGDLGQNPRNLRAILAELNDVMSGAD